MCKQFLDVTKERVFFMKKFPVFYAIMNHLALDIPTKKTSKIISLQVHEREIKFCKLMIK
jgi:hypothetical protein